MENTPTASISELTESLDFLILKGADKEVYEAFVLGQQSLKKTF